MTAAQKTASRLRWFLLILWILCLLAGIFWLIGFLFDYGTGLIGTPYMALLGPLLYLVEDMESCGHLLLSFFYLAFFFMSQWFFLRPRFLWKVRLQSSGRPMKRSAIAATLATALLSVALLYSVLDLFNVALFKCTAKYWREANPELAKKGMNIRDIASINELAVLSNLETLNAEMITSGIEKLARYNRLKEVSEYQLLIMNEKDFMKALKKLNDKVYIENKNKLDE